MNMLSEGLPNVKKNDFQASYDRSTVCDWLDGLYLYTSSGRYKDCGEGGRGFVGVCPGGHEVYHAFSCEQRICEKCAGRRSMELHEKLTPALIELLRNTSADYGLKHIVLGTDINMLDYMRVTSDRRLEIPGRRGLWALAQTVKLMRGFAVDLMRSYADGGSSLSGDGVEAIVKGWAIGCEFGLKAGTLHFHILALCKYIPQTELSSAWERFNLGHGSYCWIEAVGRNDADVAKSVGYISKYVTKPLGKKNREVEEGDTRITDNMRRMALWVEKWGIESVVAAMAYIFKGMRRFQTYGAFYDLEFAGRENEVCEVCGQAYHWVREIDYVAGSWSSTAEMLNTLSANKFLCLGSDPPEKCAIQIELGLIF